MSKITYTDSATSSALLDLYGTNKVEEEDSQEMNFMELLLAKLKNQDPLEPMNDSEMMTQFAQLTTVQELQELSSAITNMIKTNNIGYAVGLIGKTVETESGTKGKVSSVDLSSSDEVNLILDDDKETSIALSSIKYIY